MVKFHLAQRHNQGHRTGKIFHLVRQLHHLNHFFGVGITFIKIPNDAAEIPKLAAQTKQVKLNENKYTDRRGSRFPKPDRVVEDGKFNGDNKPGLYSVQTRIDIPIQFGDLHLILCYPFEILFFSAVATKNIDVVLVRD